MKRTIITLIALALIPAFVACGRDRNSHCGPITVRVIDTDSGQPLADVYVLASSFTSTSIWIFHRDPENSPSALYRTGADGTFVIPKEISGREYLGLTVWKPGYRYVWLTNIGLAAGKNFIYVSAPTRRQETAEPVSMIKLKPIDAGYSVQEQKNAIEHFSNQLKRLESDPTQEPWQQGTTIAELQAILSGELEKIR